jgi:hypothetical protein
MARPAADAAPLVREAAPELAAAPEPQSSVLPVPEPSAAAEAPKSGWRELLDDHGTASGW